MGAAFERGGGDVFGAAVVLKAFGLGLSQKTCEGMADHKPETLENRSPKNPETRSPEPKTLSPKPSSVSGDSDARMLLMTLVLGADLRRALAGLTTPVIPFLICFLQYNRGLEPTEQVRARCGKPLGSE